jgi:predicted transglutaminase-like cysteine proteinase
MNTKFASLIASLAIAISLSSTGGAAASVNSPTQSAPQPVVVAALAPLPMQFFCMQHASECRPTAATRVTVTPNVMAILDQVNLRVNRSITYRAERSDVWSLNPSRGDCEDYALSKRSALIRKGIPAGALRIATTATRRGEPHAVLIVKTSQGDYVLDNMNNVVKPLRSTGYHIRNMSSPNPTAWNVG